MENWQLALLILGAVLTGALAHVLLLLGLALFKAGRNITEMGRQITPTLRNMQIISDRMEVLTRGLEGGDKRVAELLEAMGSLSQGIERNTKLLNLSGAIAAAVGPAVSAFVQTMRQPVEPHQAEGCDCTHTHEQGPSDHMKGQPT
jgi:hypothetical protein